MISAKDIDKNYLNELINNTSPIIIDIGCYNGQDTFEFASIMPNAIIFAIEADSRSREMFENSIANASTEIRSRIHLLPQFAISDKVEEATWFACESDIRRFDNYNYTYSAASSLATPKYQLTISPDLYYRQEKVWTMPLDIFLPVFIANVPDPKCIDLVWADVNGAERELIHGGFKTLVNYTKYLYIEFSDKELFENQITKQEIIDTLGCFVELGVFSYLGNYGNLLLRNLNF